MYKGDQGPLAVTRTVAVGGLDPSSPDPLRKEYVHLEPLNPSQLVPRARSFLGQMGVNKTSELGDTPCLILLGEPRVVERGTRMVVWKILNEEVKSWGRLSQGPEDKGAFMDTSSATGLYTGGPSKTPGVYVHTFEEGQAFLNDITAAVIGGGIVFNTHSPGWASSVYHEILHTFEGKLLSTSFFFKEGFVEWFATRFMIIRFGIQLPYYPPYALAARNIEKVIRFAGMEECAKAYFADDSACAARLVPLFYKPIIDNQLKQHEALDPSCVADATMKCQFLKDAFSTFKMKKGEGNAAWYKKWVQVHGVPKGGPVV